ncbi:MAG: M1 family metallopeptidase [Novosphingobium sp.]
MRLFPAAVSTLALVVAGAIASPALAIEAPATPAATAPVPQGQLSDAARPTGYRLDMTVDPAKERFSGHVEIDAELKAASTFIDLHGRDLKMTKATATVGGRTIAGTWEQKSASGLARLTFAEALPAGPVKLAFDYDAAFNTGPAGMFRVKVGEDWYSWTQFQSIDARAAFPSFDEPGFKTPFEVTIRTPKGLKAISNAPEVSTREEAGLDVHRYAPTLPLPTYLMAMMVGPFAIVESTVPPTPQREKPLPLRIVSTKQNAGQISYALENSKPIVTLLESYFGQGFPYPKLDQITTPILPGAMENAGADLYADGILVLDEKSPVPVKRNFGMVVSHELAHQWFGDLVTPAWWDDIWLNESFANWMGFRIGGEWRPDLNIGSGATAEGFAAMNTDSLVAGRPIHQPIRTDAQIDAAFDTITYGKGGHVVAMIAAFMGDTKFRDGVRAYMAKHRYGNATSADFFGAMAQVSGDPRILPAMQSFTDQQGVPLLTFAQTKAGWTVTQSRYARLGTTPPATRWGVPLCVRIGSERSCQLMDGETATLAARGKGVLMPNAGGTGYYRFELPAKAWDKLIASADKVPANEALAMADSLKASYQAGRGSIAQMGALARKMVANPDSHAFDAALDGLEALRAAGLFDSKAQATYGRFVARLYGPELKRMGLNLANGAYAGEDPERVQRRAVAVGAVGGIARDPALRKQMTAAAEAFLGGNTQALDAMWYGSAFSAWLIDGGLPRAKDLFARAMASESPTLRPTWLGVIGGSGNAEIGRWVLDEAKDQRLRPSERLSMIRGVVANPMTRDMGYDWMKANLDQLLGGTGGIFFASRLPQMLNGFCSADQADELAKSLRPRLAGKTAELELERTIERVRNCGILKTARSAETSKAALKLK